MKASGKTAEGADDATIVDVLAILKNNVSLLESISGGGGSEKTVASLSGSGNSTGAERMSGQVMRSTAVARKSGWKKEQIHSLLIFMLKSLNGSETVPDKKAAALENGNGNAAIKSNGIATYDDVIKLSFEAMVSAVSDKELVNGTDEDTVMTTAETTKSIAQPSETAKKLGKDKGVVPEVEAYCFLISIMILIDNKEYDKAVSLSSCAINRLSSFINRGVNRRAHSHSHSLDIISARIYFYFSLSHERINKLDTIRATLLALHRTATLRHDGIGVETLLNLILRNYLHYNLYDQAEKFRAKSQGSGSGGQTSSDSASAGKSRSNHQYCRYLYYLGRIRAATLDYTEARDCLQQAVRKSPSAAHGFLIVAHKWLIIVRLLLGDIPERTLFRAKGFRKALAPYLDLTQAVRTGDLLQFGAVSDKHNDVFVLDRTRNMIVRLRHNVIRAGLRNIHLAYSKISIKDVAVRLGLNSEEDAEFIIAKAIRDGGINAVIDHDNACMLSNAKLDVYSTSEPLTAFHNRICFCLNVHNEAVKAMRFPPDAHKDDLESAEERRERMMQEQELAAVIAEEDEDMI